MRAVKPLRRCVRRSSAEPKTPEAADGTGGDGDWERGTSARAPFAIFSKSDFFFKSDIPSIFLSLGES